MKIIKLQKFLLIFILLFSINIAKSQKVNGEILEQDSLLTVLKVWGTHQERGYAYGYLMGKQIPEIYKTYVRPQFGKHLPMAKKAIKFGYIKVDKKYRKEAKAMIKGMKDAGADVSDLDYIDLLIANSFLDFAGFAKKNGCSTLMSWGESTKDSELNGKSIATRYMDWSVESVLVKNNIIVIHIPSEKDEQPWLFIGYTGQMSVLSGTNKSGLSVFQHMMFDDYKFPKKNYKYEPIWFSLRKALEQKDFDKSGQNDVNDLRAVIKKNKHGYADGFLVSALAPSTCKHDSLIAMVAELAPAEPYYTFRTLKNNTKIKGENLYAANRPILRNNSRKYCKRYNRVYKNVDNSGKIDANKSWNIMKTQSTLNGNMQAMQVIPENKILKLSVRTMKTPAYNREAKIYDLEKLFQKK